MWMQPFNGVLIKNCSENMQQTNIIEIAFRHGYSLATLLHIFRTPFPKNTSGGLLLVMSESRDLLNTAHLFTELLELYQTLINRQLQNVCF